MCRDDPRAPRVRAPHDRVADDLRPPGVPAPQARVADDLRPSGVPAPHVLVADDESELRALLALCLRRAGFRVSEAQDGVELVDRALADPPDLVVTDLYMPRLSGLEAASRLHERHPNLPVVVISGFGDEEAAREAAALDHCHPLGKPFESEALLALARALLSAARPDGRTE